MIILANSVKIVGQLEAARLDDVSCRQGERGVGAGRADLPGEADDPEEHHKVGHHAGGVEERAEVVLVGAIVIDANGEIRESLGNKSTCCVNRGSPTSNGESPHLSPPREHAGIAGVSDREGHGVELRPVGGLPVDVLQVLEPTFHRGLHPPVDGLIDAVGEVVVEAGLVKADRVVLVAELPGVYLDLVVPLVGLGLDNPTLAVSDVRREHELVQDPIYDLKGIAM